MLPIGSRRRTPFSLNRLAKLYRDGQFTDFTLKLNDKTEIKAHRVILASSSEYFARVCQGSFKESQEATVEIKDNPRLFRILIESAYGIALPPITFIERLELLRMLKYYQFYLLMDQLYNDLNDLEVPPEHFQTYVGTVELLYDELTPEMIEVIAKKVQPETNLDGFDDGFLEQLFSRDQFTKMFPEELQIFWLIHSLVREGHSKNLYRFVKFKNIDPVIADLLISSGDVTEEMMEIKTRRLSLTENLTDYIEEEKKRSLVVRINHELDSDEDMFCFEVTGDGDQTRVILASHSKLYLKRGDIVEITNYSVRNTVIIANEITRIK